MHVLIKDGSRYDEHPSDQVDEKWLVISNCQTTGLAHSFSLLCDNVYAEPCDYWLFKQNYIEIKNKIHEYAQIIISQEIKDLGLIDFNQYSNITLVPNIFFRGYHPDLCNVFHEGIPVKGPLDDYHSLIITTAYKLGLSADQTFNLFTHDVYSRLGYYDIWSDEKRVLVESFDQLGLDVRESLAGWIRNGCFMHSFNHPKMEVVFDIAKLIAGKIKGHVCESDVRPHDNLTYGPIFPIFPELAENFGINGGSYLFKPMMQYKLLSLRTFIEKSFSAFENYPKESLNPISYHYETAMNLIKELV